MKRCLSVLLLLFSFTPIYAEYFDIESYRAEIKINRDATFSVLEEIEVDFTEPRHGIYRDIPYQYRIQPAQDGEQFEAPLLFGSLYRFDIYSIHVEGEPAKVTMENGYVRIKIGSKNNWVDGKKVYRIRYKVAGEIRNFSTHSELFWNVLGDRWPVHVMNAGFQISWPEGYTPTSNDFRIYTGAYGSRESDSESTLDMTHFYARTTRALDPYEGITVWMNFPKGFFHPNPLIGFRIWMLNNGYIFIPLLSFLIAFLVWRRFGKDKKVILMAEYAPPTEVTPAEAGVIIDDNTDNRDLLSLIYYWAANGHLEIEETKAEGFLGGKDYTLIRTKPLTASSKSYEKTLFNGLFKSGDRVSIKSLQYNFYPTFEKARGELNGCIDAAGYYEPWSREFRWIFLAVGLGVIGLGFFFVFGMGMGFLTLAACLLGGLIFILFSIIMPKKSALGLEKYRKLAGFRLFIQKAEMDRLKRFIEEDPLYFDRYLSYAIAFGLGDQWAKHFQNLVTDPPRWYHGYGYNTFNTLMFMNALNSGMSTMNSSLSSPPPSSGSSGGGFGGFSGGGGGGGGGGSW